MVGTICAWRSGPCCRRPPRWQAGEAHGCEPKPVGIVNTSVLRRGLDSSGIIRINSQKGALLGPSQCQWEMRGSSLRCAAASMVIRTGPFLPLDTPSTTSELAGSSGQQQHAKAVSLLRRKPFCFFVLRSLGWTPKRHKPHTTIVWRKSAKRKNILFWILLPRGNTKTKEKEKRKKKRKERKRKKTG